MDLKKRDSKAAKFLYVRDMLPKSSYIMHIVVGIFMLYLVYELLNAWDDSVPAIVMILVMILFAFVAIYLFAGSFYALRYGIYRENRDLAGSSQTEMVDVVDEDGNPTGETVDRVRAHADGICHRTSHVWVLREKDGNVQVLLQKRSDTKDSFPGCYDTSSAGHIPAGQDFAESALREIFEELGVKLSEKDLIYIGRKFISTDQIFYGKEFHDRQVSNIYATWLDMEEGQFTVQKEELSCVKWFDLLECIEQIRHNEIDHCINLEEITMIADYAATKANRENE